MTTSHPTRPFGTLTLRVLTPGDIYTDYLGRSQLVSGPPLVEFYSLAKPDELQARYRWPTLQNYRNRHHSVVSGEHEAVAIRISAEELDEVGGDINQALLDELISQGLNTGDASRTVSAAA